MDPLLLVSIVILIICTLGLSWFAGSDAPFVATKIDFIRKVLKKAGVKKGKIFYELGSGDGRVVLEAAKLGANSHGVEQSWIRVWWSRYQAKKKRLKNCHFYHGDIFQRNYYIADFVYIFLLPKGVEKLEKKLKAELKKDSVIITQTFHFKSLKPFKKIALTKKEQADFLGPNQYAGDFWIYKIS